MFNTFNMKMVKMVQAREVKLIDVKPELVTFEIDDEHVTIRRKGGCYIFSCSCKSCGTAGVANGAICSRMFAAYEYVRKLGGEVCELYIDKVK